MKLHVELNEQEIRKAIAEYLEEHFNFCFLAEDLPIEVKSKQNYRSEWEHADIRVKCEVTR